MTSLLRLHAGGVVRTLAAVCLPSLAVLDDRSPELGIVLFVVESLLASLLLLPRAVAATWAAARADARASSATTEWRLRQAGVVRERIGLVIGLGLVFLPFLWLAARLAWAAEPRGLGDTLVPRATWLVAMLAAGTVLDLVLGRRSDIAALQSAVAWQLARVAGLHPVVLFGFLLLPMVGSTEGLVWLFVALRLGLDLASLRPGTAESLRHATFGRLHPPSVVVDAVTGAVVSQWPPPDPPLVTTS